MSAAGVGTVGVNKVASEALNTNVPRAYTEWVAGGYPPKLGRFMEVPFKFWGGALAVGFAAAGACVWANRKLFATTVHTMTPQFQAEAARIGPVAQRTDAPPVFLNPIYNRIPGRFLGPEDVEAETK